MATSITQAAARGIAHATPYATPQPGAHGSARPAIAKATTERGRRLEREGPPGGRGGRQTVEAKD